MRTRIAGLRARLEQTLVWRVWERMLEIEFVDRSVALAGKAFVSFFPLVIVVAAFVPERLRSSIVTTLTSRLGLRGDALVSARDAIASSDDVRKATGIFGLILTIFFATSFTTALQRVFVHAWRRPLRSGSGSGAYWRGIVWLGAVLVYMSLLGAAHAAVGNGLGIALFAIVAVAVATGLWWFSAWFLLLQEVRPRVLVPTGVITGLAMSAFAASATVWMPTLVVDNETQFGVFGLALSLVTWFSGAAIFILVGACAGPVFAEDPGWIGRLVRGSDPSTLSPGVPAALPPPTRDLTFRDALQSTTDS